MPTALVTGAAGQDGGYLCERLVADGWAVHGLVRAADSVGGASPWLRGVEVHDADLADSASLRVLIDEVEPEEIYNLAALSSVARSWDDPVTTALVNGTSVVSLLEAAWRFQERSGRAVRLIQASSAEIFGDSAEVPQRETTPIAPVNPYGAAKAFAHHMISVYRGRGLHAVSCVLYNHESPRRPPTFVTRKITRTVVDIARGNADRLVLGTLTARRDWGWAPDYVDAMVRAARAERAQDFIVATGEARSVEDFVAAAFACVGVEKWRHLVSTDPRFVRAAEASLQVGDASRAREVLGWRPTVPFDEIVRRMVAADQEGEPG